MSLPSRLGQKQGDEIEGHQLGGEGLGGGHPDLRPGVGIEHRVRVPGDAGAHRVDDGQGLGPQLLAGRQPGPGVRGLAGLGDGDQQGMAVHQGVAVAELGAQIHLHRHAAEAFDQEFAHHGGVKGGAAGHQENLAEVLDILVGEGNLLQHHLPQVRVDAAPEGVDQGPGLLEDLLLHEVLVARLFRHGRAPGDGVLRPLQRLPVPVRRIWKPPSLNTTRSWSSRKITRRV